MSFISKPHDGEYDPYAIMYIKLLPNDGRILEYLQKNGESTARFFLSIPKEKLEYRYAPEKWTIKEILLHIADCERIFAYRALRIARGDTTPLPGFDQDPYTIASKANERSIEDLVNEYETVRAATLSLFIHLPEETFMRSAIVNDHPVTVRALLYQLAGHELHHLNMMKEKYLS